MANLPPSLFGKILHSLLGCKRWSDEISGALYPPINNGCHGMPARPGRPFLLGLFLFLEERLNADKADDGNARWSSRFLDKEKTEGEMEMADSDRSQTD